MSGPQSRMPKGIQFVKSSDTLKPASTVDKPCFSQQPSFSNSSPLLPTPPQNPGNPSSSYGAGASNPTPLLQFGGPAVSFGNKKDVPVPAKYNQSFVKSGDAYSSLKNESSSVNSYCMPGFNDLNLKGKGKPFIPPIPKTTTVQPVCSNEEYLKAWKNEKEPLLEKIRKLAYEVVSLKSDRPNAMDKIHSAANRVPIRVEFNIEPIMGPKNSRTFVCKVFIEKVDIASGQGSKNKSAKSEAYEATLKNILMPHMRIVSIDPTSKYLDVSLTPFTSPPRQPSKVPLQSNSTSSCQHKESNLVAAGLKRRVNEYKNLDEFVIVEPLIEIPDCTAAHTLRRSADFNHMLLEYEYFFKGESARCILKIENEVLADVNGASKVAAKNKASVQALARLKNFCWVIKTKKAVDSNSTISKDEIFNELSEQSDIIANDNIGNKMLRKMGWSGGGVGKDGDGIAEPVSLKSVLNREGLGLGASKGITDEFKRRIKEVIENYASSDNQEDLVFSSDFRLEERQIIHDECRRLNLRSKSRGKGTKRYLVVRRKRSVNQLFDHLMSVGGETTRYKLMPPGTDLTPTPSNPSGSLLQTPSSVGETPGQTMAQNNVSGGGGVQFGNNTGDGMNNYGVHNTKSKTLNDGCYNNSHSNNAFVGNFGGGVGSDGSGFGYDGGNNSGSRSANNQNRPSHSWNSGGGGGNGYYQNGNRSGGFRNDGQWGGSGIQAHQMPNSSGRGVGWGQDVKGDSSSRNFQGFQRGNDSKNFGNSKNYGNNMTQNNYNNGRANNNMPAAGLNTPFQASMPPASSDYWNPGVQSQGYGNNGQGQGFWNNGQGQGFGNNGQFQFQGHGNRQSLGYGGAGQNQGFGNNGQGGGSGFWPSSSSYSSYPQQNNYG